MRYMRIVRIYDFGGDELVENGITQATMQECLELYGHSPHYCWIAADESKSYPPLFDVYGAQERFENWVKDKLQTG